MANHSQKDLRFLAYIHTGLTLAFVLGAVGSVYTGAIDFVLVFPALALIEFFVSLCLFNQRHSRFVWLLMFAIYSCIVLASLWFFYAGVMTYWNPRPRELTGLAVLAIVWGSVQSLFGILAIAHI